MSILNSFYLRKKILFSISVALTLINILPFSSNIISHALIMEASATDASSPEDNVNNPINQGNVQPYNKLTPPGYMQPYNKLTPQISNPPEITVLPSPLIVNTTAPSGTKVEYQASATDDLDGQINPTCSPASGVVFQVGNTTVTCRATDSTNQSASKSFTVTVVKQEIAVPNNPPTAEITFPPKPYQVNVPLAFSAQSSTDSDGRIVNYVWSLGDGTTYNGPTVTHTYKQSGQYTVKLNVTDNRGASEITTRPIVLSPDNPPEITVPPSPLIVNTTAPSGTKVEYQASATDDLDGQINPTCSPASGVVFQVGNTTVTCRANDSFGNIVSKSFTVTVVKQEIAVPNNPPTAEITFPPKPYQVNVPLAFSAQSSTDSDGRIVNYVWSLGDGTTYNGPTVTHTYKQSGQYTVKLNVTDNRGASEITTRPIVLSPDNPPEITVPPSPLIVNTTAPSGTKVEYQASATDDLDGQINPTCSPASGVVFQVGNTTVTCRATDSTNQSASKSFVIMIQGEENHPPVISGPPVTPIEVQATSDTGLRVSFEVKASDLEDGNMTANCNPPSGSIFEIGQSIVKCTVMDNEGTVASTDFPVIVRPPQAVEEEPVLPLIVIALVIIAAAVVGILIMILIRRRRRMSSTGIDDDEGTQVY